MSRLWLWLSALVACGLSSALADTIQLKDKAAIVGKVLAEKPDQIAVDVGYTSAGHPAQPGREDPQERRPGPRLQAVRAGQRPPPPAAPRRRPNPNPASTRAPSKPAPVRTVLRTGESDRRGRGPGAHAQRTRLRFLPQRGRVSHHQFPRHRGRDPDFGRGLSPEGRPARSQDLQAGADHRPEQVCRPGLAESGGQGRPRIQESSRWAAPMRCRWASGCSPSAVRWGWSAR